MNKGFTDFLKVHMEKNPKEGVYFMPVEKMFKIAKELSSKYPSDDDTDVYSDNSDSSDYSDSDDNGKI